MQTSTPAVYSVAQVRELERQAIADHSVSGALLMARAGRASFQTLKTLWPQCRHLVVVCGTGNNGGDGWVVAQLAVAAGWQVSAVLLGEAARIKGEARLAWDAAKREGVAIIASDACTAAMLDSADVIVDALIGIGLTDAPRPGHTAMIDMMNRAQVPVLSIDVPSGLNADTGHAAGAAVVASATQTFIALKGGLLMGQARAYCGDIHCATLGLPAALYQSVLQWRDDPTLRGSAHVLSLAREKSDGLSARSPTAHKGTAGHLLVIGGDDGLGGAGILAAEAGLRTGAGLVSLACHAHTVTAALARRPEIMAKSVVVEGALVPLLVAANVIAIGPGLGQQAWGQACFHAALGAGKSMVIDADGLNLLAAYSRVGLPPALPQNSVITPHPGEAARLLGVTTAQIEQDRFAAVRALVVRYRCTVVLKGAGTLMASFVDDDVDDIGICTAGNPGMASGGMGDVLTGVIAALMAQGMPANRAASFGVCLHAEAADMAAVAGGQRGLLASDLLPIIRRLVD